MKKENQSGFTLIEVLLATLISSVLSILLFAILNQIRNSSFFMNNYIDIHTSLVIFYDRLQKDLLGATIPQLFYEQQKEIPAKSDVKTDAQSPAPAVQETSAVYDSSAKPPPRIDHLFFSENYEDGQLKQLTFITNNPLPIYSIGQKTAIKPLLVRVWYELEKEEVLRADVISYRLLRKESIYLPYKGNEEEKTKRYELISNIARCKLQYTEYPTLKKENTDRNQSSSPQDQEPIVMSAWNKEDHIKSTVVDDADKKKEIVWLPHVITVIIELWDERYQRTVPFKFIIPLLSDNSMPRVESSPSQNKVMQKKSSNAIPRSITQAKVRNPAPTRQLKQAGQQIQAIRLAT